MSNENAPHPREWFASDEAYARYLEALAPPWTPPSPHELLVMIRDSIRAHPERHDNRSWYSFTGTKPVDALLPLFAPGQGKQDDVCGTTACVAGEAGIFGSPPGTMIISSGFCDGTALRFPDGTEEHVQDAAERMLGLSSEQANYLFEADRTRGEVLEALDALIEDAETELPLRPAEMDRTVVIYDEDMEELHRITITVGWEDREDFNHIYRTAYQYN